MTRWLVTGGRGQLGTDLQLLLEGEQVLAVDLPEHDITDAGAVDGLVNDFRPDVVLNAAAYTNVDGAEADPRTAEAVNADAPAILAERCARAGALLVHVSTDYVFAGDAQAPYEPDDPVDPRSVYGRTKAAGERAVLDAGGASYVVRTAWVYGCAGQNFVKTMARLERERDTLSVVDDQRGSPTWSAHLAAGLLDLVRVRPQRRLLHCTNAGETTWFGFARAIFDELGADPQRVQPTDTASFPRPAPRPAYSVLSGAAWAAAGLAPLPDWREALRAAFARCGDALRG